jgi:hypothetical protein
MSTSVLGIGENEQLFLSFSGGALRVGLVNHSRKIWGGKRGHWLPILARKRSRLCLCKWRRIWTIGVLQILRLWFSYHGSFRTANRPHDPLSSDPGERKKFRLPCLQVTLLVEDTEQVQSGGT